MKYALKTRAQSQYFHSWFDVYKPSQILPQLFLETNKENEWLNVEWFLPDARHEKSKRSPDEELQIHSEDAISALTGE